MDEITPSFWTKNWTNNVHKLLGSSPSHIQEVLFLSFFFFSFFFLLIHFFSHQLLLLFLRSIHSYTIFLIKIWCVTFLFLSNIYIIVNFYQFYFLSCHFSSQLNKKVFHLSIFPSFQLNTYERTKFLLPSYFFIPPTFSILQFFHPFNQTEPKSIKLQALNTIRFNYY